MLNRVVIIGVGLIGTSFALALKRVHTGVCVAGIDTNATSIAQAIGCGAIDRTGTLSDVAEADLVLLAIPVRQMAATFASLLPLLDEQTILIDVGSTKQDVISSARATLGDRIARFVPCHPIAGRERHGPLASEATLFTGKNLVITRLAENSNGIVQTVADIWRELGANVVEMSAETHDAVFAAVSHLPHMLAYVLVDELASRPNARTLFENAASGFRDFTRIAGSSPEMWRDIALNNRAALLLELDAYLANATHLRNLLAASNETELFALMARAQDARERWGSGRFEQFHDNSA